MGTHSCDATAGLKVGTELSHVKSYLAAFNKDDKEGLSWEEFQSMVDKLLGFA